VARQDDVDMLDKLVPKYVMNIFVDSKMSQRYESPNSKRSDSRPHHSILCTDRRSLSELTGQGFLWYN
jgi:hypothetical protein